MALALAAAQASAQPPPSAAALQPGVGARTVRGSTVKSLTHSHFAVLFLYGEPAENKRVCERFVNLYAKSWADGLGYEKYVFLPIRDTPSPTSMTCQQAVQLYDQQVSDELEQNRNLYLQSLPRDRAIYLMLITREADGLYNKGHLLLSGSDGAIDGKLRLFNRYYKQPQSCWVKGEIREKGMAERLLDDAVFWSADCDIR